MPSYVEMSVIGGLVWWPYVPEYERYGGPRGVEVAEGVFDASSTCVLGLLPDIVAGRVSRETACVATMIVMLGVFADDVESIAALGMEHALSYAWPVSGAWERLFQQFESAYDRGGALFREKIVHWCHTALGGSTLEELASFREGLCIARDRLRSATDHGLLRWADAGNGGVFADVVRRLLPSYLHMHSIRLGLTRNEEAFLSYSIARALR